MYLMGYDLNGRRFQSLIGILQTASLTSAPSTPSLFQSLIGILQTITYNSNLEVFVSFQSLIGILQTGAEVVFVWIALRVSIPYRYSTNSNSNPQYMHIFSVSIPYRYSTNPPFSLEEKQAGMSFNPL